MASPAVAISPSNTSSARVPELDGIRGIAILLVLATHFGYPAAGPGLFRNMLSLGWVGVDLFFVLSGFLITGILLATKGRANYFQRFYLRRLFRILPIYYAFLILIFHGLPFLGRSVTGAGEAWYWLYIANWRNGSSPYLQHFWSLAIEEQFYLGWPLLVHLCSRRSSKLVCVSIVLLSPVVRFLAFQMGVSPFTVYEVTPLRLDGLAFGALLALADGAELRRARRWVPAACAAAILGLISVIAGSGASHVVLVQREMESGRAPLASITPIPRGSSYRRKRLRRDGRTSGPKPKLVSSKGNQFGGSHSQQGALPSGKPTGYKKNIEHTCCQAPQ